MNIVLLKIHEYKHSHALKKNNFFGIITCWIRLLISGIELLIGWLRSAEPLVQPDLTCIEGKYIYSLSQ